LVIFCFWCGWYFGGFGCGVLIFLGLLFVWFFFCCLLVCWFVWCCFVGVGWWLLWSWGCCVVGVWCCCCGGVLGGGWWLVVVVGGLVGWGWVSCGWCVGVCGVVFFLFCRWLVGCFLCFGGVGAVLVGIVVWWRAEVVGGSGEIGVF
ncbi:hypothetical protein, partial [Pseudomonas syringae group genomosp. 7]|uniref:hypothetical protein n=1 Tax=Pseudomonas syringae group genomosp. 7 TaxID=251699 RepID=UPI00376FD7DC